MQHPHYSVPIPTLPAKHIRFAPVRNKRPYLPQHTVAIAARNQAPASPAPSASHPVTPQPQTTVPDSDKLLNHPPIKPSDTPSDTSHKNTSSDYSVSKKNKDRQAKSVTPEAKPVKKHNSSFVWIVVTVFIILGIIVAAVIFLYKRSQDS